MWALKYQFRHKDCKYLPLANKLKIHLSSYPINSYIKNSKLYVSAIHLIAGEHKKVKNFVNHLRKISIKTEEIAPNIIFTLTVMKENLKYYKTLYSPLLFYPAPIVHCFNYEQAEIMCWEKAPLSKLLELLAHSKDTTYFKLLSFKQKRVKNVFLMNIAPNITSSQREIYEFALNEGYYNYPRKINLAQIAAHFRCTKSNCHEKLRRAEHNLFTEAFKSF